MTEARRLTLPGSGSLRGRLLWRLGCMLAVLPVLGSIAAYWSARDAADIAYDRTLLASARDIASSLYATDGALRAQIPYAALDSFAYDNAGAVFHQVRGPDGKLISGYEDLPAPPAGTPRTHMYPALARFYDAPYRGSEVRVVSLLQPISHPQTHGMAEIRVAETHGARDRLARDLLGDTLIHLALSSIAALLMVWYAVSAGLRPLDRLRTAVEERRPDDLRPLPAVPVQRELRPLVDALNHFTARLRGLFLRQQEFIADASHELRTPLAALKARLELGLRERDPQAWREALVDASRCTDKLANLAGHLLSHARIEAGARAITEGGGESVALSRLARELCLTLAPLAHSRGIELALEAKPGINVIGDPILLHELLNNLVGNALAHAQSSVIVRAVEPARIEVEDDGPGIPQEERERVFERFYHRSEQGTGLGLSIVGKICLAHQAEIELAEGMLGGLLVIIHFRTDHAIGPASE